MLKKIILVSLFILFLIPGCSASYNSVKVNPGMNRDEVIQLMGNPGNRQFNGNREAWQYCDMKAEDKENEYVVIWFDEGKVTGLTTYRYGHKYGEFVTIDWDIAPKIRIKGKKPVFRN
jgi:outer membrane protein assembly factor BamE (lipoprotein component of BamABCDE complex)